MSFHPWMNDRFDNPALAMIKKDPEFLVDCEDTHELAEPVSVAGWFPSKIEFSLDDSSGPKLADSIPNLLSYLVASAKLKDLLLEHAGTELEVYPVEVKDAKGKIVKQPYFLVHVTEAVACMDAEASSYRMSNLIKTQVAKMKELVLAEGSIPEGKNLFRLAEKPGLLLVRDTLADILAKAKITGMILPTIDEWNTTYRCKT